MWTRLQVRFQKRVKAVAECGLQRRVQVRRLTRQRPNWLEMECAKAAVAKTMAKVTAG